MISIFFAWSGLYFFRELFIFFFVLFLRCQSCQKSTKTIVEECSENDEEHNEENDEENDENYDLI